MKDELGRIPPESVMRVRRVIKQANGKAVSIGYINSHVTIKPDSIKKILWFLEEGGFIKKIQTTSGNFWLSLEIS